jgi:putative membrane protein
VDGLAWVLVVGQIFAGLAALTHVYIWVLESVLWSTPSTYRTFGVRSAEEAETLRPMAYNQGFYNLFLAFGVVVGIVLTWVDEFHMAGLAVMLFACLSMVLAAVVLITSNRRMARAALVQGAFPLLSLIATAVYLLVP